MAAYAALLSLMNLLEQLQRHPRPPITLHTNQVQTLTQKIAFLQDFLEVYNSHYSKPEMEHLRNHIANVAYTAKDVIETRIVDWIHAPYEDDISASFSNLFVEVDEENRGSIDLHGVIRDMSIVEKEVLEIKDTLGTQDPQRFITMDGVASKSTSTEHNIMVGFDEILEEMLDKLTRQPHSRREIIPISGMGGMGKTTLARNVYIHRLTQEHFYIRVWITFSQEYNVRDILLGAYLDLNDQEKREEIRESMSERTDKQIGDMLFQILFGRKYLVVMDDMWSHKAWDRVSRYFPDQCNGSRIIVTTRQTNLLASNCPEVKMDFLDHDKSWSLFCKSVFGKEDGCPSKLEDVGKEISRNCKGLPLWIVVIGGLLAKSEQTHNYWQYIAENLNSIVNLEENERCFKILHTSYDQLPAHLKACFLYMGLFPKGSNITVSQLIRMWVAESFLKPISGKGSEEIAEEYLMDIAGRNLIMVHEGELFTEEKLCNIHDLLRDLCIREAEKEKFPSVANKHSQSVTTQQRFAIHQDTIKEFLDIWKYESTTSARSLRYIPGGFVFPVDNLRLRNQNFKLVNMRYLSFLSAHQFRFDTSLSQLWNLQTLYIWKGVGVPPEIWKMPLIRYIEGKRVTLPDPPSGHMDGSDDFVLHELHTLETVRNLKLGEELIKRIPNVSRLKLHFDDHYEKPLDLKNLDRLCKLEDLSIWVSYLQPPSRTELLQNLIFPHSLKKLALCHTRLHWEDISTKIGSLPRLQMLILHMSSFEGPEWETVEGQFCSLKYLHIELCHGLKHWSTESAHFPCLERLQLVVLLDLEEIPSCIGDIPMLKSITVQDCSPSAIESAKRILEEQKELGNENLRVIIQLGIKL